MKRFEWDTKYCTGIEKIDRQHAYLFDLVNHLLLAMQREDTGEVLPKVISELDRYIHEHFSFEEDIMRQAGYADIELHTNSHRKLKERYDLYADRLKAGLLTAQELHEFMGQWLTNHILYEDMQYVRSVSAQKE